MTSPARLAVAVVLVVLAATAAEAHGTHIHDAAPAQVAATNILADEALPEGTDEVRDQDGRRMSFREALGDGTFLLSFSFKRCEQQCPIADLVMDYVATRPNGTGARLVTLTLDPANDDVAVLKEKSLEHPGGGDRLWLTGDAAEVGRLLRRFGMMAGSPAQHDVVFVVGNVELGLMTRTAPSDAPPPVEALLAMIRDYETRARR